MRSVWPLTVALALLSQTAVPPQPESVQSSAGTPQPQSAALSGRVLGENDRPLPGVSVQAFTRSGLAGRLVASGVRAKTDLDGRFRLDGLRPDAYYLMAQGSTPGAPVAEPTATGEIYVSTYFPGAQDVPDATRLTVTAGEDRSDLDIRMAHARAYHIAGQVLDPDRKPPELRRRPRPAPAFHLRTRLRAGRRQVRDRARNDLEDVDPGRPLPWPGRHRRADPV